MNIMKKEIKKYQVKRRGTKNLKTLNSPYIQPSTLRIKFLR